MRARHSRLGDSFFSQIAIQSERAFYVICTTKRSADDSEVLFHLPVMGEGVLKQMLGTCSGIQFNWTVVSFMGRDYDLSHVGGGLNGSVLVVGIYKEDDRRYPIWELYTDIASDPDDLSSTSEELRKWGVRNAKCHRSIP